MVRAGFQGDRAEPPRSSEELPGGDEVDDAGEGGDEKPDSGIVERDGVDQPDDGGEPDTPCRHQDQRTFETAREILRLGVAVRVLLVRRPGRDRQDDQRDQRRHQIHQRFQRVRKERDRPRQLVRGAFQNDGCNRGDDRG